MPDYESCLALLGAVAKQWLKDAQRDPHELASLATWLGMTPAQLQRRQAGQWAADPYARRCPGCGRVLPKYNAGASGAGRQRVWCSRYCQRKTRKANHVVE